MLYKYLGTKEGNTGSEPKPVTLEPGDRFMLCSDGVTDGANSAVLADLLLKNSDPQTAAEQIVEAAQQGGSRDNITCVVIHVE